MSGTTEPGGPGPLLSQEEIDAMTQQQTPDASSTAADPIVEPADETTVPILLNPDQKIDDQEGVEEVAENSTPSDPAEQPSWPAAPDAEQPAQDEQAEKTRQRIDGELDNLLNETNDQVENRSKWGKFISKYRRSASLRIITGLVSAATTSAIPVQGAGMAVKFLTSFLAGSVIGSSIGLKKHEGKLFQEFEKFKTTDKYGQPEYDFAQIIESGALDNLSSEELLEIVSGASEIASIQGLKIDKELQADENDKFKEKAAQKEWLYTLQAKYKALPLMKKLAFGAVAATAGFGLSALVGGGAVGIAASGALQLGFGAIRSQAQKYEKAYDKSDLVDLCKQKLIERGDLDDLDSVSDRIKSYQNESKHSFKKGSLIGGGLAAGVAIAASFLLGNPAAAEGKPTEHDELPPEPAPTPETDPAATLHLKESYFAQDSEGNYLHPENAGADADKRLAELVLKEQMNREGIHYENHDQFEAARDHLTQEWQSKGMFNPDGSLKVTPEELTHQISGLDEAREAAQGVFNGEIKVPENPDDEVANQINKSAEQQPIQDDKEFPLGDKATFDSALELNQNQIDHILDPDNGYISKELATAIKREIEEGRLSYNDIKISYSDGHELTDLKIHFTNDETGREYIGHQLLKQFKEIDTSRPWWKFWERDELPAEPSQINAPAPDEAPPVDAGDAVTPAETAASDSSAGAQTQEIPSESAPPVESGTVPPPIEAGAPAESSPSGTEIPPSSGEDTGVVPPPTEAGQAELRDGEKFVSPQEMADKLPDFSNLTFKDIPADVIQNMKVAHPDWNQAQMLSSYQSFLKMQAITEIAKQQN